jgi:hypothetical protein
MSKFSNMIPVITSGFATAKAEGVKVGDNPQAVKAQDAAATAMTSAPVEMTEAEKAAAQAAAADAAAKADAEAAAKAAAQVKAAPALSKKKLPEFMGVGRDRRDPFQKLVFPVGVPVQSEETSWVKCQVEAGILKRC